MKSLCIAVLCAMALNCAAMSGFDEDYDAALARARTAKTQLLVLFTGSDWCVWCKRLESEVLSKPEFLDFATNAYVLAVVDMPSDKSKQSAARQKRNSELVSKFNVRGFPTILLVDSMEKVVYSAGYEAGGAETWVESFRRGLALQPVKDKYLGGIERRLRAFGEKFAGEMMSAWGKTGDDKRKQAALLKGMAAKHLPEISAIGEELEGKAVPDELKNAKEELSRGVAQTLAMLEEQSKLDLEEFAAELEKLEKDRKEQSSAHRARAVRHVALPRPGDAKVDAEYFAATSMPFYERHLVETFAAPSGMKKSQAKAVLGVRRALARRLATGREEFPSGEELESARKLWNGKCRDAAVAIAHYIGMLASTRRAKGSSVFEEAAAAHDFVREPVLGFILRAYQFGHEEGGAKGGRANVRAVVGEAAEACEKAFEKVAGVYKEADGRIFSEFAALLKLKLPEKVFEAHGDEYMICCKKAYDDMHRAFDARGSGWASTVTDEGWKGWGEYNSAAESNLLAAVSLRPDDWQAPSLLASLAGRTRVSRGDEFSWFGAAVSNSLDGCAERTSRLLWYQTSRWGGSTEFLRGFMVDCATNVDVRSTFSYHGAAEALRTILNFEVDTSSQSNIFARIVTGDVAAALYGMFDAYVAAPESPFMPDADVFRGMGMSLAIQLCDWKTVRRYWKSLKKPLRHYADARWLRNTNAGSVDSLLHRHQFEVLGRSRRAEKFIDAEELLAEGRLDDALNAFSELQKLDKLTGEEKMLASGRFFETRKAVQDARGGWVDIMPSAAGGEANNIGGMTYTDADGRARSHGAPQAYYRIHSPIPGIGVEIEGAVHFEQGDKPQTRWDVGWGLARRFSGRNAASCCWAFPYVAFSRDERGDHFSVQSVTRENSAMARESIPAEAKARGCSPQLEVAKGDLKRKDDHSFSVKTAGGDLVVVVDGAEVYRSPLDDMRAIDVMRYRIQPDGNVFPVWKIHRGTSFSGYRYRRVE